jgi:hypothetical protein
VYVRRAARLDRDGVSNRFDWILDGSPDRRSDHARRRYRHRVSHSDDRSLTRIKSESTSLCLRAGQPLEGLLRDESGNPFFEGIGHASDSIHVNQFNERRDTR